MKNRSGEIRLIAASIICTALILYNSFQYLCRKPSVADLPVGAATTNSAESKSSSEETKSIPSENTAVSEKKTASSEKAITAAAKEKAKGKVVSKFFSPYTANTSYNGIYLKNSTGTGINIKELVRADLPYKIVKNSEPQVLIIHTHTTEAFLTETRDYYTASDQARTLNGKNNVTALGNIIADRLNAAGIKTVHDTTLHDYPAYNGSYERAAETIRKNLKKYPSIKIVIDLHRDAIAGEDGARVKPIAKINGKNAAQIMLVMGSETGGISGFPKWRENLKLALRFQQKLESMYPGLARSVSLMSRLYNENMTTGSLLLEVGTEVNSMEEVSYSAGLAADALISVLNGAQ